MDIKDLNNKHEIKVDRVWYRIIWVSSDGYVLIGVNSHGIERRISNWIGKKIRRIP